MAKKTATTTRKSATLGRKDIIAAYQEFVLEEGHAPASVFKFMRQLGSKEEEFYKYFGSFNALEKAIWTDYVNQTVAILMKDPSYAEFTVREKFLSFYYTLVEVLRKDRSFVSLRWTWGPGKDVGVRSLRGFREEFGNFLSDLLNEGRERNEIKDRRFISDKYSEGLWLQTLFIIHYWIHDDSEAFSDTDAAIEKSVNLSFELMGEGPLDKMIDFAKFLYQHR